jgi:hypothetical protein
MSESTIAVNGTAIGPAKRRRKLARVYCFVISLARQKKAPVQGESSEPVQPAD